MPLTCSGCGRNVADHLSACQFCGAPVAGAGKATCPGCGRPMPAAARSCLYCGTANPSPAPAAPPPRAAPGAAAAAAPPPAAARRADALGRVIADGMLRERELKEGRRTSRWAALKMGCLGFVLLAVGIAGQWLSYRWGHVPTVETSSADEILALHEAADVTLSGARVAWDRRLPIVRTEEGDRLMRNDPRSPIEVENPAELLRRAAELDGCWVRIASVSPARLGGYIWRTEVEVGPSGRRGEQRDVPTRVYAVLPGTSDRVWVLSRRVGSVSDPLADEFLDATTQSGYLEPAKTALPDDVEETYEHGAEDPVTHLRSGGSGMPLSEDAVALVVYGETDVRAFWAPVEGTSDRLWVEAPADRPPPEEIRGRYDPDAWMAGAPAIPRPGEGTTDLGAEAPAGERLSPVQGVIIVGGGGSGGFLRGWGTMDLVCVSPLVLGVVLLLLARAAWRMGRAA